MSFVAPVRQAGTSADPEFSTGAQPGARATFSLRTVAAILASAGVYYFATRVAWMLCFPDSKVSLFFPPHAVMVSILLLVPTRHWWAYTLAAASAHFFATQQADWPVVYALQCEAFDAVKYLVAAAGIRTFIKSPFDRLTLREAVIFVLIAVILVPFVAALWGAAFTVANHFGTHYWVEWRNLGVSNGVTTIVLVPAILVAARVLATRRFRVPRVRVLEACLLALGVLAVGYLAFNRLPAGPDTSPAYLYAPVPFLVWAALRFGLGGISATMLGITLLAIWGTMQGHGPFLDQAPEDNALALQLFVMMLATPLVLLAVAIGDERRSQMALRMSDQRMSLAAESAQLALWDWDMVNHAVWLSEEGRRFFGFDPGQVVDYATLSGRVHPDDRVARKAAVDHALATGGSYDIEFRMVLPDGSVRWIAARGRRQNPVGDEAPRVLGVSMDITGQKQAAAEMLAQREELAHLSRVAVLSTLSGSLAHELSQPLGSILNNAQAGQRYLAQDPPDLAEVREILADIVTENRRAGDIIDRLRTMLRRGEVALQPISVNECLGELLHLTRSDLVARGVTVANLAVADLPPAMTDRVQLQQVLLNLIVNACDAMKANRAEDRKLTLTTAIVGNEVHIGVLDCGVGLPDDVETLFQPFHSTKEGGLGMGLSISRTLVAAHRGRLWAERRPEGGAAFYVALPLAKAGEAASRVLAG